MSLLACRLLGSTGWVAAFVGMTFSLLLGWAQVAGVSAPFFRFVVLEGKREVLERRPTWPWRAETQRGFASAVALPHILLLVQLTLERIMR